MSLWGVTYKETESWDTIVDETFQKVIIIVHKSTIDLFSRIVKRTPVDTGRTRGNWQFQLGSPAKGIKDLLDKSGATVNANFRSDILGWNPEITGYISNNVPWINKLEDGGYPNPPKNGTRKKDGSYEIRSAGGYSKQAPKGMVKISVAEFSRILKAVII